MVRSANTGISSIIDHDGRVLDSEEPLVEGYVVAEISQRHSATLYSVIGNTFVYLNLAAVFALFVIMLRNKIVFGKSIDK